MLNDIGKVLTYDDFNSKPKVGVDWDGCISTYKHGWQGADIIQDEPVEGAIQFLEKASKHFELIIFSTRCNHLAGILEMQKWLSVYGLTEEAINRITFQPGKPPFHLFIDDRATMFQGNWNSLTIEGIHKFKPWYYGKEGWGR